MDLVNETAFQFAYFPGRLSYPNHTATFIVKGTFDLVPGGTVVPAEDQLFPTGDEFYADDDEQTGGIRYASDFAWYKPRADLMLVGTCHVPGGASTTRCPVRFSAGQYSHSLLVFGDRYWVSKAGFMNVSGPEPFSSMELRYEKSYGGTDIKENPCGKGADKVQHESGVTVWPLPNIEDPAQLIGSPDHRPEPAGLAPLRAEWATRSEKVGSYKKEWLETRWPWLAEDIDWTHFNAAPPAMQADGFLSGDEPLVLENLHPEHAVYQSRLPGIRVRCFVRARRPSDNGRRSFYEVQMSLDTLWVDADAEKLVLSWRGWSEVETEQLEEIEDVLVVSEDLKSQALDVEYYYELLTRRLLEIEQEWDEEDEFPEIEEAVADDEAEELEIAALMEQVRAGLAARGIDMDNPPEPSQQEKEYEAKLLEELGFATEEEAVLTRETVEQRAGNRQSLQEENLTDLNLAGIQLPQMDLRGAALSGVPMSCANLSASDLTAAELAGADLGGADLRGACLRDADLTGANLEKADLRGAILEGAEFADSNLNGAILDNVQATGAGFSGAGLRGASVQVANLDAADLSLADLNHADFSGTSLRSANLEGAAAIYASFRGADLTDLRASSGCDFSAANFSGAIAHGAIWVDAVLNEADFSHVKMEGANFAGAMMCRANLDCCNLKQARLSGANLQQACLTQVNLFEAILEKASLTGADLRGSNLYGAELLETYLDGALMENVNLKMTKLAGKG